MTDGIKHTYFGALEALQFTALDGASITVTPFGAHLVSWIPAGGSEQLFCSLHSVRDGSRAIRGGVPVIFPQFADQGHGVRHGFARLCRWQLKQAGCDGSGAMVVRFTLDDAGRYAGQWPESFVLNLESRVTGTQLSQRLTAENTGTRAFSCALALHSYFRCAADAVITGLQEQSFEDMPTGQERVQAVAQLTATQTMDRIYRNAPDVLVLQDRRNLRITRAGFDSWVAWNPGADAAAALPDLGAQEYREFVCIEPEQRAPVLLIPGQTWSGACTLHLI